MVTTRLWTFSHERTRVLFSELAPQGIRVVGLRPQANPETGTLGGGSVDD